MPKNGGQQTSTEVTATLESAKDRTGDTGGTQPRQPLNASYPLVGQVFIEPGFMMPSPAYTQKPPTLFSGFLHLNRTTPCLTPTDIQSSFASLHLHQCHPLTLDSATASLMCSRLCLTICFPRGGQMSRVTALPGSDDSHATQDQIQTPFQNPHVPTDPQPTSHTPRE